MYIYIHTHIFFYVRLDHKHTHTYIHTYVEAAHTGGVLAKEIDDQTKYAYSSKCAHTHTYLSMYMHIVSFDLNETYLYIHTYAGAVHTGGADVGDLKSALNMHTALNIHIYIHIYIYIYTYRFDQYIHTDAFSIQCHSCQQSGSDMLR